MRGSAYQYFRHAGAGRRPRLRPGLLAAAVLFAVVLATAVAAGCGSRSGGSGGGGSTSAASLAGTSWKLTGWSVSSQDPNDFTITAEFKDGRIGLHVRGQSVRRPVHGRR